MSKRFATSVSKWFKKYIGYVIVCSATSLVFLHCGDVSEIDSGVLDARILDSAPDAPPPPNVPSSVYNTSGGGFTASASYRAQISIGAPSPMGNSSSSSFQLQTGPNPR